MILDCNTINIQLNTTNISQMD